MPCPNPITFSPKNATRWSSLCYESKTVGCGKCYWCRFVRTRQWALRCYLENLCHQQSAFITLTYAPKHLPKKSSLVKKDVQDFIKRLRRNLDYQYPGTKIRFYASGEYGDLNGRPHYHILIFGFGFPDQQFHRTETSRTQNPYSVYRSKFLEKTWKKGFSELGNVNLESASYVAGYIRKKINGDQAEQHYKGREPEFSLQSTTPGIGYDWYQKNKSWLWKEDMIRCNGKSYRPPRYFEKILQKENPELFAEFQITKKSRLPFKTINGLGPVEELSDESEDDLFPENEIPLRKAI